MGWDSSLLGKCQSQVIWREETASTNDDAMALGRAGVAAGTIVVAERQTAGRGRRGRAWVSAPDESLAFSVLARPKFPRALWGRLALIAGLAVAEALETFGYEPRMKWPNDVLLAGRKVCGILVETDEDFAVIGIGLNVLVRVFPEELAETATSLWLVDGQNVAREGLLAAISDRLEKILAKADSDFTSVIESVRARCAYSGRRVRYHVHGSEREGIMRGWGDGGEMLVERDGQIEEVIQADEVRAL